jgi:hypothetical protein
MAQLSPAAWLPILSAGHQASQRFTLPSLDIDSTPAMVETAVETMCIQPARYNSYMEVRPVQRDAIIDVWAVTKLGWLDLMRIDFKRDDATGGTQIHVRGWSTGFFPLSIPGAALLNVACFFIPFGGVSYLRVDEFKQALLKVVGGAAATGLHSGATKSNPRKDEI